MNILFLTLIFIVGYIIGSFPTAYIIGKLFTRVDIRKLGSGNVGATNVFRVSGILPGLITLIIDVGKGFIVVWGVWWITTCNLQPFGISYLEKFEALPLIAGLAAVIGHNWSIFLKGKGGKGVATTLGVCLALYPQVTISVILVWLLVVMLTRYVSLSSLISAFTLPLFIWLYFTPLDTRCLMGQAGTDLTLHVTFGLILALLILWRHQDNLIRLIQHQERKFSFSKSGQI